MDDIVSLKPNHSNHFEAERIEEFVAEDVCLSVEVLRLLGAVGFVAGALLLAGSSTCVVRDDDVSWFVLLDAGEEVVQEWKDARDWNAIGRRKGLACASQRGTRPMK